MKTIYVTICLLILSFTGLTQNLLNKPESVVYDSIYERYLVSNWGNGSVVQIDSNGVQSYFSTGNGNMNGIYIAENIVFAACSTKVKGFDLLTGDIVMDLTIPGAVNLNDITADNSGYIYITAFDTKKIFKVNIESQTYSTFVDNLSLSPNGILYDTPKNRLLLCSFGYNIPILAINLEDSTVSVVANTSLAQCDGFAKDDYGNYYISSWATYSIHKFDSTFSNSQIFYSNSEAPVDICYNSVDDIIAAPIMWLNTIVFLPVNPNTDIEEQLFFSSDIKLFQIFPNPSSTNFTLKYSLLSTNHIHLVIANLSGKLIKTLINKKQQKGEYEIIWDGTNNSGKLVSVGVYCCRIQVGNEIYNQQIILTK